MPTFFSVAPLYARVLAIVHSLQECNGCLLQVVHDKVVVVSEPRYWVLVQHHLQQIAVHVCCMVLE